MGKCINGKGALEWLVGEGEDTHCMISQFKKLRSLKRIKPTHLMDFELKKDSTGLDTRYSPLLQVSIMKMRDFNPLPVKAFRGILKVNLVRGDEPSQ